MIERKLFTITDLGGGDGGKGGVIHKVCTFKNAHTVIKVGGSQGSHGVKTSDGQSFNFSQFGCGTFEGAMTHLSSIMIVDPIALIIEGNLLRYEAGILNIWNFMTIDRDAVCLTPAHRVTSQLRELLKRDKSRGTIGTGAGQAFFDAEADPNFAIRVRDIGEDYLFDKLEWIRKEKENEFDWIGSDLSHFLEEDRELALELLGILRSSDINAGAVERFRLMTSLVKVVDADYLRQEVFSRDGVVVVEASHGVLNDYYYGFNPHTSKLRIIPQRTLNFLSECGYDGEIVKLACTRAYQIRHGAGPMVTEDAAMLDEMLPNSSKDENRWQGKVRIGPLDFVMLRYAVEICGGAEFFDGICVTWMDQIQALGEWKVCDSYEGATDLSLFSSPHNIKIRHGADETQLAHQAKLGRALRECRPNITTYDVRSMEQEALVGLCQDVFQNKLGVPVKMIGMGPTDAQKLII